MAASAGEGNSTLWRQQSWAPSTAGASEAPHPTKKAGATSKKMGTVLPLPSRGILGPGPQSGRACQTGRLHSAVSGEGAQWSSPCTIKMAGFLSEPPRH